MHDLATRFSNFFCTKIDTIRVALRTQCTLTSSTITDQHPTHCGSQLHSFPVVTTSDIRNLLNKLPTTSCALDPLSTWLLKDVQNDILEALDQRYGVILVLLDMSAAFDTVDHGILLSRQRIGMSGPALMWMRSYLSDRWQSRLVGLRSYAIKFVQLAPEAKKAAETTLPLQYATNSIPFNASDQMRRTFMPPSDSYHTLTPDKMADFVFVTAASSNHFAESVDAIAAIQTLMPEKKIYFFDIGLKANEIAKVKSWCSVTYRYFNMSTVPKFTVLREHSALFWIDASFRLRGTDLSDAYRVAKKNGGFVIFNRTGHSNFAVTHPDMYRYLATNTEAQKKIEQSGGGMMLIYRTEKVFRDILWWYVMCAKEARCFVPNYTQFCSFARHDRYTKFAKCHRFDQAAINLILSNIWIRDNSMVYNANETFFKVVRGVTHKYGVKTCN
ncbi:hypothetical protein LSAT2_031934 [Lamellibrachia satsuma]|nr:hypothetical protein LSAT2_031934 [Lamellibrachia satsuma]